MLVLGIETWCDETSAAVVDDDKLILSNIVWSQIEEHRPYNGVVPEIAARAHLEKLDLIIDEALNEAKVNIFDLDAIAATAGPGLIGGLIIGLITAKGISAVINKPIIGINHLEGHALSPRLSNNLKFPYLLLLVSGGHTQILKIKDINSYELLSNTLDDACGECFDKIAKMLNLGFPGGPSIEIAAKKGDPDRYLLPRPMINDKNLNFSFSGLKTAVLHKINKVEFDLMKEKNIFDMAASFQKAVGDIFADRLTKTLLKNKSKLTIACAGGVASNLYLRNRLQKVASNMDTNIVFPPLKLCTDNGAMIAWAGVERLKIGLTSSLSIQAKPRWPLNDNDN